MALNHWKRAVETHNSNFPGADHDCVDISASDPRRYRSTRILIASPECTNQGNAKGKKRPTKQMSMFSDYKPDPAAERSRATMFDVPRFAEFHDYDIIVVENVVEARDWVLWDAWLHAMDLLDYYHKCVYLNAMHVHPTPQSRDRMYVVFWKKNNQAPNLEFTRVAHCPKCEKNVDSVQVWKKKPYGRYKRQYIYLCPNCQTVVEPYYYAAASAIDWSLPIQKIGDRHKPLKDKTMRRIAQGLHRFAKQPIVADLAYDGDRATSIADALPTQTTRQTHSIVVPPFIMSLNHSTDRLRPVDSKPLDTVMPHVIPSLVVPPFIVELRNNSDVRRIEEPLSTICTSGAHHGIVVPNAFITRDRHALVTPEINIEDCGFRMLQPHEIKKAMAFPQEYIVTGTGREQVRQLGNAVCPPVMELIMARCIETLQ